MLPIRDTIPSKNIPVITIGLLFFYSLLLMLTAMPFASYLFAAGNLLLLYIFGEHVEDRLGIDRTIVFYILCSLTALLISALLDLQARQSVISFIGIVSGVLGAYFSQYPRAKILTFIPLVRLPCFYEIPALLYLILWFIAYLFLPYSGGRPHLDQMTWWFPLSGLVFGLLYVLLVTKIPPARRIRNIQQKTIRLGSPRFQVIRPVSNPRNPEDDPNRYGMLTLTTWESQTGATKFIYLPPGILGCFYKVKVPAGIRKGQILKVHGLGKNLIGKKRGDLHLKLIID